MKPTATMLFKNSELNQLKLSTYPLDLNNSIKKNQALIEHHFKLAVLSFDKEDTKTAKQFFLQALRLEKILLPHQNNRSLLLETMQYLSKIYIKLDCPLKAKNMLLDIYRTQVTHFQTQTHADIANTLHFLGDVYMKMKKYKLALDRYKQSLHIKQQFFVENSPTIIITQQAATLAEKEWKNTIQKDLAMMVKLLPPPKSESSLTATSHQRRFSL